ncbi:hypothetical protein [Schaalia vaccimaxillae]|uniref:sunset domain-containing protein n=1 Tax=Schaalia vaccimaxillae TaxID=183916 RepID=UPI0003B3AAC1
MDTGWKTINGTWYHFNTNGAMTTNSWVGGYYLQSDGSMAQRTAGNGTVHQSSGSWTCPSSHPIKGNKNSYIYHLPGQRHYARTKAEICFATQDDARSAGFRKSEV